MNTLIGHNGNTWTLLINYISVNWGQDHLHSRLIYAGGDWRQACLVWSHRKSQCRTNKKKKKSLLVTIEKHQNSQCTRTTTVNKEVLLRPHPLTHSPNQKKGLPASWCHTQSIPPEVLWITYTTLGYNNKGKSQCCGLEILAVASFKIQTLNLGMMAWRFLYCATLAHTIRF